VVMVGHSKAAAPPTRPPTVSGTERGSAHATHGPSVAARLAGFSLGRYQCARGRARSPQRARRTVVQRHRNTVAMIAAEGSAP